MDFSGVKPRRGIRRLFSFCVLLLLFAPPCFSLEGKKEEPVRVIRVGFPYFRGFSEFDDKGNHWGYAYDFLVEIAKYNGWKYEFYNARSDGDLLQLLAMLDRGELDLVPGLVKDAETKKRYDFPEYNCGESFSTLVVLKDNSRFTESDLSTFDGMKVGVLKNAQKGQAKLKEFSESNDFSITMSEFESENEMFASLEQGAIDVALSVNLTYKPQVRTLVSFSSDPYYIAVAKNKKDLLRSLNTALIKIKEQNIDFDVTLFRKYFPQTFPDRFVMSEQEKRFVASLAPVRVVSGTNTIPVDYFNNDGDFSGITAGILSDISKKTGIQFEYMQAKNFAEAFAMLSKNEADLITGFFDEEPFRQLDSVFVSVPYISVPLLLVKGKSSLSLGSGMEADPVLAPPFSGTVSESIQALGRGKLDYFFGDIFSVDYYRRYYGITDITTLTLPDSQKAMAFGIKTTAKAEFLSLFNRAIRFISNFDKQRIILESLAEVQSDMSLQSYIRSNAPFFLLGLLFLCAVIVAAVVLYLQKKRKIEKLSAQRYRILAQLSGEILFEYDFAKDTLVLPAKSAARLGVSPVVQRFYARYCSGHFSFSVPQLVLKNILNGVSDETGLSSQEFQLVLPDKTVEWYSAVSLFIRDGHGRQLLCIGKLRNVSREHEEKNRLIQRARCDSLTGLYNKGAAAVLCGEFFAQAQASDDEKGGAFFLIDIDNFKLVNDTWGHLYGDEVLASVGRIIQIPFRPEDIAARIGGDEFMVFVKNLKRKDKLSEKAQAILAAFRTELLVKKNTRSISCSIGIALYPHEGTTYEELYTCADIALYRAKNSGKNRFYFFDEDSRRNGDKAETPIPPG